MMVLDTPGWPAAPRLAIAQRRRLAPNDNPWPCRRTPATELPSTAWRSHTNRTSLLERKAYIGSWRQPDTVKNFCANLRSGQAETRLPMGRHCIRADTLPGRDRESAVDTGMPKRPRAYHRRQS